MKIWYRNMPPDQTKFPVGWKEIQSHFLRYTTSLRKRKVNDETIPQRPLYLCKGLSLGNYKCKIEIFLLTPVITVQVSRKNYLNHSSLTQEKMFIEFICNIEHTLGLSRQWRPQLCYLYKKAWLYTHVHTH